MSGYEIAATTLVLVVFALVIINSFVRDKREEEAYQTGWEDAMGLQEGDSNGL